MKRNLGWLGAGVVLSIAVGFLILTFIDDDSSRSTMFHISKEEQNSGIRRLDIEFKDKNVVLNVLLSKPLTCDQVFETLGVEDLPLRGKIYSPVCTSIKPEKIVITYKEMVKT